MDELLDGEPYLFIRLGRALGEQMHAAVDVRTILFVKADDGVDDGPRLLRRRGVVQVDEWLAVHELVQRGKVFTELGSIETSSHGADAVGSCSHSAASDCLAWGKARMMIFAR